ncbi:MAG TPA: MFS transporter [Acidobacteriota bacterium]|nr:MFS transporter [Acidobacteriota bacterium]
MSGAMLSGFYSVFIFGIVVAFLGSIKLKLAPRIGADDAQFGKIVAALQWTMVVMAILAGLLLDTLGFRVIVIAGALLSALAIFLIGRGKTIGSVIAACLLLGVAGQFVNVAGNTLNPMLFDDLSAGSNLGNAFFGLGALLIPILTAFLFTRMSYGKSLSLVALVCLPAVLFALFGTFPTTGGGSFSANVALGLLGNHITWLAALTLFCYIGLEVSMAVWITSYASELGASENQASKMLSLFFVAMMIGRLVVGLQDRVTGINLTPIGGYVLVGAALIAAVAITMMMRAKTLGAARNAVLLAGIVFAPMFPTTIGVAFQHFEEAQRGTLFGLIFAIGLIGASTIPAWIGSLAKGKSVASGLNILRVTAIALAVIAALLGAAPLF